MNSENPTRETTRNWRPKASFYHPNAKGTGAAMELELIPADGQSDGSIMLRIANQTAIGSRQGPTPTFARFDWANAIVVKLNFNDLCKLLQVLRGECESLDEGKGLYHSSAKAKTRICFRHVVEMVTGYSLELYRTANGSNEEMRAHIMLNPAEALGISEAIAGSLAVVCFGVPRACERGAASGEGEGAKNAAA